MNNSLCAERLALGFVNVLPWCSEVVKCPATVALYKYPTLDYSGVLLPLFLAILLLQVRCYGF